MQAVTAHREVAAEYRRERGAEDFRLPWHRSAGNIMHTPQAALFRVPLTLQRISIPARIVREETDRGRGLAAAPQMTF